MAAQQPDLRARLEALLAQLAQLDVATARAVEPAAAASLARGAQVLGADVQELADCPERKANLAGLSNVTSGVPAKLEALLSVLAGRLSCQQPPAEADLSLLLAASELLHMCTDVASVADADQLPLAQAACNCFLTFSPTVAAIVAATARNGSGPVAVDKLVSVMCSLLALVVGGIWMAHHLDASAAELAPPDELAACLAAVVDMTQQLGHAAGAGRAHKVALQVVLNSLYSLGQCPAISKHVHAMAAHERLPSGMLELTLSNIRALAVGMRLPPNIRPCGCNWEAAGNMARLVRSALLDPEVKRWVQAADGASTAAAMAAGAQLVQQMPLDVQQAAEEEMADFQHFGVPVAALPGLLCLAMCQDKGALTRQNTEQRRRVAAQLLPAFGRLPQLVQLAAGGEQPASLLAQQLQDIVDLCGPARFQVELLCRYRHVDVGIVSSPADAAAWAQAASAALRCLPLLHELHAAARQAGHTAAPVTANFALDLDELAVRASGSLLRQAHAVQGLSKTAASEALQAAWALHTALCRRLHFAAAASSPEFQLAKQYLALRMANALSQCMCAAAVMHHAAFSAAERRVASPPDALVQANRQLQGMSVAHWQALAACGSQHPLAQMRSSNDGRQLEMLLPGLAAMLRNAPLPLLVDPRVQELFGQLWREIPRDAAVRYDHLRMMLRCAMASPRLGAFLATGGFLELVIQEARRHQAEGLHDAVVGAMLMLQDATEKLVASSDGASSSNSSSSSRTPAPDGASSGDAELIQQLRQHHAAFVLPKRPWTVASVRAALPAARQLAAALLDWWRRPGAQQEQQLEAAHAAAVRSCAYLHCANLGGGGGPAAREGEGSRWCSGCRTAWYCGTACSHADWRAGHKRMCQALGAARAAEKAVQAAEDAEAGQEQAE